MGTSAALAPSTTGTSTASQYVHAGRGAGGASTGTRAFGCAGGGGGEPPQATGRASAKAMVVIAPRTIGANASLGSSAPTIAVSFTKNDRRRFEPSRARFVLPSFATSPMVRLFVFALAALVGAVYGLVRHYTMPVPTPPQPVLAAPAPTYDADAGEYPVPEMYLQDGGAP